jgi:M6 family metalloprotease-like protein
MRTLGSLIFAFLMTASNLRAEPEQLTIPPRVYAGEQLPTPRIYADFDLSEYKTTATAKTTKITKSTEKRPAQPAYLGLQLEASNNHLRVAQVDSQSPAANAGLRVGDIVKTFDGKTISTAVAFRDQLREHHPNDLLAIGFERNGKGRETKVTLAAISSPLNGPDGAQRAILGIQTNNADKAGVKITQVTPGSAAEKAELKVGDIIMSVAGKRTEEVERLTEVLSEKKPGDKVTVLLSRDGKEFTKEATLMAANDDRRNRNWDSRGAAIFRRSSYKLAMVCIAYPDQPMNEKIPPSAWAEALFSKDTYLDKNVTGQKVFGSLRDYYWEQSCHMIEVGGKVFEPVKVSKKRQEYSNTTTRTALLSEALDLLRERDGKDCLKDFDGIFFLYAGETAATQRAALYWPHRGNFSHKGERWNYFICPEGGARMATISTTCHEFGHMLGLPDLYAKPEVPESEGLGQWCAMSNQIRSGRPQHFCAWSKEQMGWITPTVIDPAVPQKLILSPIEGNTSECFKVLIHADGSEYLLLENRKRTGFDTELPGEGLLIWRVVDGKPILEESHGILGPRGPGAYQSSVPFPSKANNSFTPLTTPSSKSLKGGGKEVHITNIRRLPDGKIVFQIGYEYF